MPDQVGHLEWSEHGDQGTLAGQRELLSEQMTDIPAPTSPTGPSSTRGLVMVVKLAVGGGGLRTRRTNMAAWGAPVAFGMLGERCGSGSPAG
jgi:hypothetical protein